MFGLLETRVKRLENRVRFLEKGKESWKEEAKKFKAETIRLKEQISQRALETEADETKKNLTKP